MWSCLDHSKKTVELSGDKSQVVRQQRIVQQLLRKFSDQSADLEHIRQTHGRKAYLHAFSSKPDVTAPSHWTSYKGNLHDIAEIRGRLVQADAKLRHAVSQLVTKTWSSEKAGEGKDAVNLHHKSVTVSNVWQIENVLQYKRYVLHMKEAYKQNSTLDIPQVSGLQGEKGIQTKGSKELEDLLLLPELNECFLFHGTSAAIKDAIVHQGIDYRLGSQGALFGQGCYFTESSTKADQYAGKMN